MVNYLSMVHPLKMLDLPSSIDSVGLFDVVEHIEDDYLFLKSINKYLKDDGYIYITVPALNFLYGLMKMLIPVTSKGIQLLN